MEYVLKTFNLSVVEVATERSYRLFEEKYLLRNLDRASGQHNLLQKHWIIQRSWDWLYTISSSDGKSCNQDG